MFKCSSVQARAFQFVRVYHHEMFNEGMFSSTGEEQSTYDQWLAQQPEFLSTRDSERDGDVVPERKAEEVPEETVWKPGPPRVCADCRRVGCDVQQRRPGCLRLADTRNKTKPVSPNLRHLRRGISEPSPYTDTQVVVSPIRSPRKLFLARPVSPSTRAVACLEAIDPGPVLASRRSGSGKSQSAPVSLVSSPKAPRKQYAEQQYWDERYEAQPDPFDWLFNWKQVNNT